MKLFDFITISSIMDSDWSSELNRFADDLECDVFPFQSGIVLVICDTQKLEDLAGAEKQYAMFALERYGNVKLMKLSDSKEELLRDYATIVKNGLVSVRSSNSSALSTARKILK